MSKGSVNIKLNHKEILSKFLEEMIAMADNLVNKTEKDFEREEKNLFNYIAVDNYIYNILIYTLRL